MKRLLLASLALAVYCPGCFDPEPHNLSSSSPSAKIPAIKEAVAEHNQRATPQLVDDLSSDDPAVRFYAIQGLQRLTGQTFGYVYYEEDAQRRPAVLKWRQWLNDQSHR